MPHGCRRPLEAGTGFRHQSAVPRFHLFDPRERLGRDYWLGLAPGVRRVEIEIGCGDGRFLLEAARADPATLFVGFEVSPASVAKTERRGLPGNALVRRLDGRWVVENLLADASIDAYHVYFPDPWWKKRHAKRRLFSPTFATALRRTLLDAGCLYLLTDVETRYREIRDALAEAGLAARPWERLAESPAQSAYERKYRTQGRRLFGARFVAR